MADKKDELTPYDQPTLGRKKVQIKKGKDTAWVTPRSAKTVWLDRGWTLVEDKKSPATNSEQPKKEND